MGRQGLAGIRKGAVGGEEEARRRDLERRLWELEWREERLEREKRRKNLVVRRMLIKEGDGKREVTELLTGGMEVEVAIQWVRSIGTKDRDGRGAEVVGLAEEKQKRKVLENRTKLRGRKEVLDHDLTFRGSWRGLPVGNREEERW